MLQTMSTKSQKTPEKSKLLLEFPIRLHYKDLNQKVLRKVDTGSDINCISLGTFQRLFPNKQLNRSTLLLEIYGNAPVSIIGKFTAFIRQKGKVFHQEFYVTNANSSPNLLSRDTSFRIKVLQTCFMVTGKEIHLPQLEPVINKTASVSKIEEISQSTKPHRKMEEVMHSIDPESLRKSALTKQKILDVYVDAFEGLRSFSGEPYKFKLKRNYVPARPAPRKVPIHLRDIVHQEINDLVKQGVLVEVEHSTELVIPFVIVEKDVSMDRGNFHTPHHQMKKKLWICLNPRDLNKALQCEPYYS